MLDETKPEQLTEDLKDDTRSILLSDRLLALAKITVIHPDFKRALKLVARCIKSFGTEGEPICGRIFGGPGCGKSHLSNRFLRRYPESRKNGTLVMPILRVHVPSAPTVKGLSTTILDAFGDEKSGSGSEQQMAIRIRHYAARCATRLIIIEELQHFVDEESEKRNIKLANWFKLRIEETRIPFVVEGLPRAKVLFDQDQQLRDRFDGPIYLRRFIWYMRADEPTLANKQFKSYLHKIREVMPFDDCVEFGGDEMALRFFCASHGVPRRIGKLLKEATIIADELQTNTFDMELLRQAHERRRGYSMPDVDNPFSKAFDLKQADKRLFEDAKKPRRLRGEGVIH